MVVAAAELVPGVLMRMAGTDPPYSAPTYVVASNAIAIGALIVYVNGTSNAIVMDADMPGRTPPMIPHATPKKTIATSGVETYM